MSDRKVNVMVAGVCGVFAVGIGMSASRSVGFISVCGWGIAIFLGAMTFLALGTAFLWGSKS